MSFIEMSQITKIFGNKQLSQEVLKGVNLSIEKEEFVAIIGRSGSGKSTLMNILGGLERPTSGKVKFDGTDIFTRKDKELVALRRRKIGFVFQSFHLIPVLTVQENIELPQIENDSEYVKELLDVLELKDKAGALPEHLSGGEQQRVAIARALINRPILLIADEPTGNLDSISEKIVLDLFQKCLRKFHTTVLLVTHDPEIASQADRILEIRDGVIYES